MGCAEYIAVPELERSPITPRRTDYERSTELDLMMPSSEDNVERRDTKMEDQFNRHHGAKRRHFDVGDAVYARDYSAAKIAWAPGFIAGRLGSVMYLLCCGKLL
ncbi:hypothetical protein OSTOST_06274 [Ostertagia ostertagi]